jgi:hypothetical protein
MVHRLQVILTLLGGTALGAVSFTLGLTYLGTYMIVGPRPGGAPGQAWETSLGWMALIVCSGSWGAITGVMTSIRWVAGHGNPTWGLFVWIGTALGATAGVALSIQGLGNGIAGRLFPPVGTSWLSWFSTALLTTSCATLGGIVAGYGEKLAGRALGSSAAARDQCGGDT